MPLQVDLHTWEATKRVHWERLKGIDSRYFEYFQDSVVAKEIRDSHEFDKSDQTRQILERKLRERQIVPSSRTLRTKSNFQRCTASVTIRDQTSIFNDLESASLDQLARIATHQLRPVLATPNFDLTSNFYGFCVIIRPRFLKALDLAVILVVQPRSCIRWYQKCGQFLKTFSWSIYIARNAFAQLVFVIRIYTDLP